MHPNVQAFTPSIKRGARGIKTAAGRMGKGFSKDFPPESRRESKRHAGGRKKNAPETDNQLIKLTNTVLRTPALPPLEKNSKKRCFTVYQDSRFACPKGPNSIPFFATIHEP